MRNGKASLSPAAARVAVPDATSDAGELFDVAGRAVGEFLRDELNRERVLVMNSDGRVYNLQRGACVNDLLVKERIARRRRDGSKGDDEDTTHGSQVVTLNGRAILGYGEGLVELKNGDIISVS